MKCSEGLLNIHLLLRGMLSYDVCFDPETLDMLVFARIIASQAPVFIEGECVLQSLTDAHRSGANQLAVLINRQRLVLRAPLVCHQRPACLPHRSVGTFVFTATVLSLALDDQLYGVLLPISVGIQPGHVGVLLIVF